jgi:hypothetical protein
MKTAVEWLEERLNLSIGDELKPLRGFFVIAKEMEKKQIENAFDISKYGDVGTGEDYYNYLINDFSE